MKNIRSNSEGINFIMNSLDHMSKILHNDSKPGQIKLMHEEINTKISTKC